MTVVPAMAAPLGALPEGLPTDSDLWPKPQVTLLYLCPQGSAMNSCLSQQAAGTVRHFRSFPFFPSFISYLKECQPLSPWNHSQTQHFFWLSELLLYLAVCYAETGVSEATLSEAYLIWLQQYCCFSSWVLISLCCPGDDFTSFWLLFLTELSREDPVLACCCWLYCVCSFWNRHRS